MPAKRRIIYSDPLAIVGGAIAESEPRFISVHGGRASGKTYSICMAIAERATTRPTKVLMLRATKASIAHSSKAEFESVIQDMGLSGWTFGARETTHENGSVVAYWGLLPHTAHSVRSFANIDIAWVDEAQYIARAPLRTLLPTIRRPRSQIVFSLNPLDKDGPVYKDFCTDLLYPDMTLVVQANYDTNHWASDEIKAQAAADRLANPELWEHEWKGAPMQVTEAQVFRFGEARGQWDVDDLDDVVPRNAVPVFGLDIGQGKGTSVMLKMYHWPGIVYIAREAVLHGFQLHHDELMAFAERLGVRAGDVVISDKQALPIRTMAEGWTLKLVPTKPPGGEHGGVSWLKSSHISVHPSCEFSIKQIPLYSLKVDPNTEVVLNEYAKGNDDVVDAMRYGFHQQIYGIKKAPKPPPARFGHY